MVTEFLQNNRKQDLYNHFFLKRLPKLHVCSTILNSGNKYSNIFILLCFYIIYFQRKIFLLNHKLNNDKLFFRHVCSSSDKVIFNGGGNNHPYLAVRKWPGLNCLTILPGPISHNFIEKAPKILKIWVNNVNARLWLYKYANLKTFCG